MNELTAHPIADLLPMMTEEEFRALKDDIAANGLLEPIWLYQGQILDGRNRYRACVQLGIQVSVREYTGNTPATFVLSMHTRRSLTKSQWAAVGLDFLPHLEEEAAARMTAGINQHTSPSKKINEGDKGRAIDHAAKLVGCNPTYIFHAKTIRSADPELFEKVKCGGIGLSKAYKSLPKSTPSVEPKEGTRPRKMSRGDRAEQIRSLAADGYRGEQIAEHLGIKTVSTIREIAREYGITLPEFRIGKTARIRTDRVIEETVNSLIGLRGGLEVVRDSINDIEPEQASAWAEAINEPLKSLNWLNRKLREIANGN